jgi:hypothetical protein
VKLNVQVQVAERQESFVDLEDCSSAASCAAKHMQAEQHIFYRCV